jgi:hypothetical protein
VRAKNAPDAIAVRKFDACTERSPCTCVTFAFVESAVSRLSGTSRTWPLMVDNLPVRS